MLFRSRLPGDPPCPDCEAYAEHLAAAFGKNEAPKEHAPSRVEQFDAEIATITQRRGEAYGHPLDGFGIASQIAAAVECCPDPEVRHVLRMIGVKMSRLCVTPDHVESFVDIAGYARTALMVLDERDRRKQNEQDTEKSPG